MTDKTDLADRAAIKQDIDYIMHVEHELPMEWYTGLEKTKQDLVDNTLMRMREEGQLVERELKHKIASDLANSVGNIVFTGDSNPAITIETSSDLSTLMG